MMKYRWVKFICTLMSIAFIGVNIYLIESADRLNYVSDWGQISNGNLVKIISTEGVITPTETYQIFIDKKAEFSQFFVQKGDKVESGTPLFEYAASNIDLQTNLLNSEIANLLSAKNSMDTLINDLENMKSDLSYHVPGLYGGSMDDMYGEPVIEDNNEELILSLDRAIAEKEFEKEKIDHEIRKYEEQREAIESGRNGLTVTSPYTGIVENISFELDNPVISIISESQHIEGRLFEEQMNKVQEGMKANIRSNQFEGVIASNINKIEELPLNKPDIDNQSMYRFTADLNNHDHKLYVGYHVQADIVIDEALNVPVVPVQSVVQAGNKNYLWILNDYGMIEKRSIQTGLEIGKRQEIKSGAELDEYYVVDQQEVNYEAPFITPYQFNNINRDVFKEISEKRR